LPLNLGNYPYVSPFRGPLGKPSLSNNKAV
jgi:hypothetical protein